MGVVGEWTLVVAAIADVNDGKNCGATVCRWALKIQEHNGDVAAAIASENDQPAPPPTATRERLFNMITGKMAGFPVMPAAFAKDDDSSSEGSWGQVMSSHEVEMKTALAGVEVAAELADTVSSEDLQLMTVEEVAAELAAAAEAKAAGLTSASEDGSTLPQDGTVSVLAEAEVVAVAVGKSMGASVSESPSGTLLSLSLEAVPLPPPPTPSLPRVEVAVLSSSPSAEEKTLQVVVVPVPPLSSADAAGQGLHLPSVGGREGGSVDGGDSSATASVGAVLSAVTMAYSAAPAIAPALAVAGAEIAAVPVSPPLSPSRLSDPGDGGGGTGSSDYGGDYGGDSDSDLNTMAVDTDSLTVGAEVALAALSLGASVVSGGAAEAEVKSLAEAELVADVIAGGGLPSSPSPSHPQSAASAEAVVAVLTSPSDMSVDEAAAAARSALPGPSSAPELVVAGAEVVAVREGGAGISQEDPPPPVPVSPPPSPSRPAAAGGGLPSSPSPSHPQSAGSAGAAVAVLTSPSAIAMTAEAAAAVGSDLSGLSAAAAAAAVDHDSDSDSSIRFLGNRTKKRKVSESDCDSEVVGTGGESAETVVAASQPVAAVNKQKSGARRRWWGEIDDNHADGITEAQFAEFSKTVAAVPMLDPRFANVFSVRASTLGDEAGRGLFFNVAEARRLELTLPLFLPLCGIARKAGGITAAEKKINGCLFDTGLCVKNEPVR